MKGSVQGRIIECSFKRKLSMNVSDFMNLKDEAYLLVGTGPVSNGTCDWSIYPYNVLG